VQEGGLTVPPAGYPFKNHRQAAKMLMFFTVQLLLSAGNYQSLIKNFQESGYLM
jgi:hypothetical protein